MIKSTAEIPPELFARRAHPTVRLSGSIDETAAASFLSHVVPVLDVAGSIVVELFSLGGGCRNGTTCRICNLATFRLSTARCPSGRQGDDAASPVAERAYYGARA
jgi:hypothetical protein